MQASLRIIKYSDSFSFLIIAPISPTLPTAAWEPANFHGNRGFAQKILGDHRPPLQLGVRDCRGAPRSASAIARSLKGMSARNEFVVESLGNREPANFQQQACGAREEFVGK